MADTPKVYVLCDQNCKYEGLTKEQIYAAIMQAVESGNIGNVDTGFITTIKTINGTGLKFFVGEQHEYDALSASAKEGLFAIITNDTTKDTITKMLEELEPLPEKVAKNREGISTLSLKLLEYISGLKAMPKASLLIPTIVGKYTFTESNGCTVALENGSLYLVVCPNLGAATLYISASAGDANLSTVIGGGSSLVRFRYAYGVLYYESVALGTGTSFSHERNTTRTICIYKLSEGLGADLGFNS